ncbi:hypothetical protein LARI1_G002271 [Lachnellula arida]|uniref:Uncharacterized protein n=1 Tax=Lachnellula arida TaxID=1316785 RepID=A0A8T9BM72_9HELO|nr:hypothetical protein LARI1_G002271 [Lachnellula arida]
MEKKVEVRFQEEKKEGCLHTHDELLNVRVNIVQDESQGLYETSRLPAHRPPPTTDPGVKVELLHGLLEL